jgi:hypothetical protein
MTRDNHIATEGKTMLRDHVLQDERPTVREGGGSFASARLVRVGERGAGR